MIRTLAYVPVLHSAEDLGALASTVAPVTGRGVKVAAYWESLFAECREYGSAWRGVPVYQDGLPDAGADAVAATLAEVDSPNYRLLRWLAGAGAIVLGAEDPVLLQEERELLRSPMPDVGARKVHAARAAGLLDARDRYIAARISASLPDGGAGMLFIGLQHDVLGLLAEDIAVTSLRSCQDLLPAVPGYAARLAADRQRAQEQQEG